MLRGKRRNRHVWGMLEEEDVRFLGMRVHFFEHLNTHVSRSPCWRHGFSVYTDHNKPSTYVISCIEVERFPTWAPFADAQQNFSTCFPCCKEICSTLHRRAKTCVMLFSIHICCLVGDILSARCAVQHRWLMATTSTILSAQWCDRSRWEVRDQTSH